MNVLFVASDNNYVSGAFLSMVKLNEILNSDYKVKTFVILPNEGDGKTLLDEIGVAYEIVPSRNWVVDIEEGKTEEREREKEKELLGNDKAICRICEVIKEKEIDILHINTTYSYVGAVAALRMNIPFVWHIREFLEEGQNRKIWNREKGYALISKAAAIVAISNCVYKKYSNVFPINKIHTIYNGIDKNKFYNSEKEIFREEKVQFGIIGGIVQHKGQEELIQACGLLKKRGISNFELKIVGRGNEQYQEYLEQLVKKENVKDNVIFSGVSNRIPEILKKIDILFVCSQNEAFGRTTVEGMMAGCLIIGADTSGTKELLAEGRNGYLYKHGDTKELAETIEYVLNNRIEAERIRKNGQQEAMEKYTATRNAREIYNLYQIIRQDTIMKEKR